MVNAIRRYIDEASTAFAFDDEINEIRAETADGTVHAVVDALWRCYDDGKMIWLERQRRFLAILREQPFDPADRGVTEMLLWFNPVNRNTPEANHELGK